MYLLSQRPTLPTISQSADQAAKIAEIEKKFIGGEVSQRITGDEKEFITFYSEDILISSRSVICKFIYV